MRLPLLTLACLFVLALVATPVAAAPQVRLELVFEQGFPIGGQQRWLQMLGPIGFDSMRIRQGGGNEHPEVTKIGSDDSPVYNVRGILSRSNTLWLPGGKFSVSDKGRIAAWKAQLLKSGVGGLDPKTTVAFGLSTDQLVAMHERLSAPVLMNTAGKSPKEVVRHISPKIGGVTIDPDAVRAFDIEWTVPEQLEGVSCGTALAAAIRPLGLVLVPKAVSENNVRLIITDVRKAPQSWPVGWPPEKNEKELVPKLFEFFTFEAPGNPLTDATGALQANLKIPFLYDHNGLVRERIEPSEVMIEFPESRSYYKKVLSRVLFQAKLKSQLRVDEAGEPFMWISPLRG